MPAGSGGTLGEALVDLWSTGGRPGGARSSYTAQGWQAQFSQLSRTKAGYSAMERAGLSATIATQRNWLSGSATASRANQGLIEQAYHAMQGGFSASWKTAVYKISGRVTIGNDSRDRGNGRNAPFLISGTDGIWTHIEEAWNRGASPEELYDLFIAQVVMMAVDGLSDSITFDGFLYSVTS